jgi:hypothetical protein
MPDPATATDRLFHPREAEEILLEDGQAPWSGFAPGRTGRTGGPA